MQVFSPLLRVSTQEVILAILLQARSTKIESLEPLELMKLLRGDTQLFWSGLKLNFKTNLKQEVALEMMRSTKTNYSLLFFPRFIVEE